MKPNARARAALAFSIAFFGDRLPHWPIPLIIASLAGFVCALAVIGTVLSTLIVTPPRKAAGGRVVGLTIALVRGAGRRGM